MVQLKEILGLFESSFEINYVLATYMTDGI